MKLADIVNIYKGIDTDDCAVVREETRGGHYVTHFRRVGLALNGPLGGFHLRSIFVGEKGGEHYFVVRRTGNAYFSVAQCITSTLNFDDDDVVVFINESIGEVHYARVYEVLNGDCDVLDDEVLKVTLGNSRHVIYIKNRSKPMKG